MYIKALIKDKQNNIHIIHVKNKCKIIFPNGFWENVKFINATNLLLSKFALKIRHYANENYAIMEMRSDNALIGKKLAESGYNVIFDLDDENEA